MSLENIICKSELASLVLLFQCRPKDLKGHYRASRCSTVFWHTIESPTLIV